MGRQTVWPKLRPSQHRHLLWVFSVENIRGLREFFQPKRLPFLIWEVCLPAMLVLGDFLVDSGGSELAKMWFWSCKCYEELLFQIADILATEGSTFNFPIQTLPRREKVTRL